MRILTWLTTGRNKAYYVRVAIDKVNEKIEIVERNRQGYVEEAAKEHEEVKKYVSRNDIDSAKLAFKRKILRQLSAELCQEKLLLSREHLDSLETMRLQLLREDDDDDLITHSPMLVVFTISFCLFLILLFYFVFI